MESIVFILLAILLTGNRKEQRYIIDKVQTEYFEEKAHAEIFNAAVRLNLAEIDIDLVSVREALITDIDSDALQKRISHFREYFVNTGDLERASSSKGGTCRNIVRKKQILDIDSLTYFP